MSILSGYIIILKINVPPISFFVNILVLIGLRCDRLAKKILIRAGANIISQLIEKLNSDSPYLPNNQFRFASASDRFLLVIGFICSVVNGLSYPFMVSIFAHVVEQFVNFGKFDKLLGRVPEFLSAHNTTWYEARKDIGAFE